MPFDPTIWRPGVKKSARKLFTDILRELGEEEVIEGPNNALISRAKALGLRTWAIALGAPNKEALIAAAMIYDRLEGKPKQAIEISDPEPSIDVSQLTEEQLEAAHIINSIGMDLDRPGDYDVEGKDEESIV
jgi:hypothetical protein